MIRLNFDILLLMDKSAKKIFMLFNLIFLFCGYNGQLKYGLLY